MIQSRTWLSDVRSEAAAALAFCGYLTPALTLLRINPFNISIQLSVLIAEQIYGGSYNNERLQFVGHCLQHGYADDTYSYPLVLIGANVDALRHYITEEAGKLTIARNHKITTEHKIQNMAVQYRQADGVESATFKEDTILSAVASSSVVSLNKTAAILWEALASPISVGALIDMIGIKLRRPVPVQTDSSQT